MQYLKSKDCQMAFPTIDEFLTGPLVLWLSSCLDLPQDAETLTYEQVIDGVLIHNVYLQMGLHCKDVDIVPPAGNMSLRACNLETIVDNIRKFYEEELKYVVIRLPDVSRLAIKPHLHVSEAQLLLKLLLGCAIQCPKKQHFVEKIEKLEAEIQEAINDYTAEVLYLPGILLSQKMLQVPNVAISIDKVLEAIRQVCRERDDYKVKYHSMVKYVAEEKLENASAIDISNSFLKLNVNTKSKNLQDFHQKNIIREQSVHLEICRKVNEGMMEQLRTLKKKNQLLEHECYKHKFNNELDRKYHLAVREIHRLNTILDTIRKKSFELEKSRDENKLEKENLLLEYQRRSNMLNEILAEEPELDQKTAEVHDLKYQMSKIQKRVYDLEQKNLVLKEEKQSLLKKSSLLEEEKQFLKQKSSVLETEKHLLVKKNEQLSNENRQLLERMFEDKEERANANSVTIYKPSDLFFDDFQPPLDYTELYSWQDDLED